MATPAPPLTQKKLNALFRLIHSDMRMSEKNIVVGICLSILLIASPVSAATYQPPKDFVNKSWTQMNKIDPLKAKCVTTAGEVTPVEGLSEDDQKTMTLLGMGLIYAKSELEIRQMKKEKQISIKKSVEAMSDAFNKFVSKEMSYDDAAAQINQTTKAMVGFAISPKGIFYNATGVDPRVFIDKTTHKELYKVFSSGAVTDSLDKKSMKFKEKVSGKLVYTGLYSKGSTDAMVRAMAPSYVGVGPAIIKLTIDQKNRQWNKSEAEVVINGEKASFPIREVCTFSYAKAANIILPKNAKKIDTATGKSEFNTLIQALQ